MDSLKGYERVTIPFDKPQSISKSDFQILLNEHGSIRAVNKNGLIIIQLKKFKGNMREVIRINTRITQPTIELAIEKIPE